MRLFFSSKSALDVVYRACLTILSTAVINTVSAQTLTRDNGSPVGDNQNSQTAGPEGPSLLQDT